MKRRLPTLPPPPPAPVTVTAVPRAAMHAALKLAGGDPSRLRPQPDGSVLVVNQGKRLGPWST